MKYDVHLLFSKIIHNTNMMKDVKCSNLGHVYRSLSCNCRFNGSKGHERLTFARPDKSTCRLKLNSPVFNFNTCLKFLWYMHICCNFPGLDDHHSVVSRELLLKTTLINMLNVGKKQIVENHADLWPKKFANLTVHCECKMNAWGPFS